MEEILEELINTNKWLDEEYRYSKYYKEYLDKIINELRNKTEFKKILYELDNLYNSGEINEEIYHNLIDRI
tara:strand:+ start:454 stop:666 length:213 start_codon:yes stop_codon:yes gene_type:complete